MINGLFEEISEQEIMSVNGGCGGGSPSPGNTKATQKAFIQITGVFQMLMRK